MFSDGNNLLKQRKYTCIISETDIPNRVHAAVSVKDAKDYNVTKLIVKQIAKYKSDQTICDDFSTYGICVNVGPYQSVSLDDAYIVGDDLELEFLLNSAEIGYKKACQLLTDEFIVYCTFASNKVMYLEIKKEYNVH